MATRVPVSDNLYIRKLEEAISLEDEFGHTFTFYDAELPVLLARLQEAAEAMGVTTAQAKWQDIATRMLEVMRTMAERDISPKDCPADMMAIERDIKALAEAERGYVA